ncbi:MAG: aminotransferase class IV [Gemmataceae bacterium]
MADAPTLPINDPYAWASPNLKQRLLKDPFSVLRERGVNVAATTPPHIIADVVRIVSIVWQDGNILPMEMFRMDPGDEGILFGRGVWESTRTVGGVPWLWKLHIERLLKSAPLLDIAITPERLPTSQQVTEYVRALSGQDVLLRLNVTAGRPGFQGTVWMSAMLRPAPTATIKLQSLVSPVPKNLPYLTWKTFQYATRIKLGRHAVKDGFDSTLLVDEAGEIMEAAHANLFALYDDGWATPPHDCGLLPGTVRQHLLEQAPVTIREKPIRLSQLREAREVFVTNSNVGIVPVTQIDDNKFPVGTETQTLIRWLNLN